MTLEFSRHISEEYSTIQFHGHPSSGNRVVTGGRRDEQTSLTKQIVSFRNLANAYETSVQLDTWLMFSTEISLSFNTIPITVNFSVFLPSEQ